MGAHLCCIVYINYVLMKTNYIHISEIKCDSWRVFTMAKRSLWLFAVLGFIAQCHVVFYQLLVFPVESKLL